MVLRGVAGFVVAVAAIASVVTPQARASIEGLALNGTYLATSNGDWAKTNDSYHDESAVRSVWTITSTCANAFECSGTVTSDKGWTAPIHKTSVTWSVDREIPNWEPCSDGTAVTGQQKIRFWRVDENGQLDLTDQSPVYAGEDKTIGPTGACGISKMLAIRMPFRLEKLT